MMEKALHPKAQAHLRPCPKCGRRNMLVARSEQVREDGCEVWVECSRCKFDPGADNMEHVETVWGMEEWAVGAAMETWNSLLIETGLEE